MIQQELFNDLVCNQSCGKITVRGAVIEALRAIGEPACANMVGDMVRKIYPGLTLGRYTVHSTLSAMVKSGDLTKKKSDTAYVSYWFRDMSHSEIPDNMRARSGKSGQCGLPTKVLLRVMADAEGHKTLSIDVPIEIIEHLFLE